MSITIDELRQEIKNLAQQQQQALVTYHQATGALALAQAMLTRLELEGNGKVETSEEPLSLVYDNGA